MEVIIPGQNTMDFDFKNPKSSPRFAAPATPMHIGEYYFSAPASPRQISQFYREFDEFLIKNSRDEGRRNSVSSSVPFDWEEKPGTPKSIKMKNKYEDDFAFDVSQEMDTASLSAEELFDGGKIRPLKPPPRLQFPNDHSNETTSPLGSPRSHRSPISHGKKIIRGAFSPKQKKELDPFGSFGGEDTGNKTPERERGRERSVSSLPSSRSIHRATRSLSPLRVSEYPWEEDFNHHQQQQEQEQNSKQSFTSSKPALTQTTSALSSSSLKGYKKWRLKDFFLFRSASEGRATGKDPLKKYASLFKKHEDLKSSSFRSIDSPGSSVSSSRRRGPVSAHELHYTMNRAVSEDLKKKTFLPYKQGILGRLAFNPAVHAIANGFGFSRK